MKQYIVKFDNDNDFNPSPIWVEIKTKLSLDEVVEAIKRADETAHNDKNNDGRIDHELVLSLAAKELPFTWKTLRADKVLAPIYPYVD